MKRYILIIIIVAIISVSITAVMINIKNNSIEKKEEITTSIENFNNVEIQNNNVDISNNANSNTTYNSIPNATTTTTNTAKEKTLDLYGTHSENDLLYEIKTEKISGYEIQYVQISGLKNKNIESKINNTIKERIIDKCNDFFKKNDLSDFYSYCNLESNFSNVLSVSFSYSGTQGNEYINGGILGVNYELINGTEINFEDIFKQGEDLSIFPRIGLYRALTDRTTLFREAEAWYDNVHFDIDKQVWLATRHWEEYNESDYSYTQHEEEVEYVPNYTEYDIEKKVKKFMKSDDKIFYFTPSELNMEVDGVRCSINFYDVPDKIVIYDKYLTNIDLYENHNIGVKGKINCSAEKQYGKYKESEYESDNLFYDIDAKLSMDIFYNSENNILVNYLNNRLQSEAVYLKDEIEKYKEIANNNLDKAYFVFLETDASDSSYNTNNLISITKNRIILVCDKNDKKEVMDEILNGYRYYNIGFYGSIYNMLEPIADNPNSEINSKLNVEKESETHYYNIYNGKEVKSVEDVFLEGVDYKNILRPYIQYNNIDNAKYEILLSGILVDLGDTRRTIEYKQIQQFVNVKPIKQYILEDSSIRNYDKSELDSLTKDELTIAYNEPFAKHGHDFQMQYLKDYFSNWDWYKPINKKSVGLEELNEFEKYNVELIRTAINER